MNKVLVAAGLYLFLSLAIADTVKQTYQINSGDTLKTTLQQMLSDESYVLIWDVTDGQSSEVDFYIQQGFELHAHNMVEAASILLDSYKTASPPVSFAWRFYQNNVLEVSAEVIQ